MQQSTPSKMVKIRLSPAILQVLAELSTKIGVAPNHVIRHAIARLAEREGIPMLTNTGQTVRTTRRKATTPSDRA